MLRIAYYAQYTMHYAYNTMFIMLCIEYNAKNDMQEIICIAYYCLHLFIQFSVIYAFTLHHLLTSLVSIHNPKLQTAARLPFQSSVLLPDHVVLAQVALPVGLRVSRHHLLLLADLLVLHGGRLLLVFSH